MMSSLAFRPTVAAYARTRFAPALTGSSPGITIFAECMRYRCNSRDHVLLRTNATKHCYAYYSSRSSNDVNAKIGMRTKRNARIASLKQKKSALEALLQMNSSSIVDDENDSENTANISISSGTPVNPLSPNDDNSIEQQQQQHQKQQEIKKERKEIFQEAHLLTLSLYRTCLRCIRIMRPGNTHDDQEFRKREEGQLQDMEKLGVGSSRSSGGTFSFEPPVDRENELTSRAFYYLAHVQESFGQEVDCLAKDPWMEDNIERFVHLMAKGEERRRWIMKEYKFKDPYIDSWDGPRLDRFEVRITDFVKKTYAQRGWLLKSDMTDSVDTTWIDDDDEIDKDPESSLF